MSNNLVTNLETCLPSLMDVLNGNLSLLYYSHIPTIILSLFFGFFVLIKGEKKLLSKIFFFLALSFVTWSILDLFTWLSFDTRVIMFTWSITGVIEALFFALSFYFIYIFIEKRDISLKYKILGGIVLLPLIIMIPTKFNLVGFNSDGCYALESNQSLYYKYFIEIILSIIIIIFSLIKIKRADKTFRKQIMILFVGIILFLSSFFSAIFLSGYLVDNGWGVKGYAFEIYGLFGTTIFMGFLGYLIVRFKAFNIKMIAAQALVTALVIIIGSELFFANNATSQILVLITLALSLGFGYMLIKSIKMEVQRKEELQLMSDKLAIANDQLRTLDNAKSEFISIASHQLRTPLTAVKGFISLLLEGSYGRVTAEVREVLNKVYTSNERLVDLVEDMLNLSRIESGRMEYNFEKVKFPDLCREIYDTFAIRAKEKKLRLELEFPPGAFPEVTTDRNKIREVISNLVDNALKYTQKGGVRLKLISMGENIRVAVTDTGIGVPKDEMPYLFSKFSRGKNTKRLSAAGTGLGLHVGKKMVEALHGKIWVESPGDGRGSTFIIELPKEAKEENNQ